jgi:MYXO-CTERM domain-containing protein
MLVDVVRSSCMLACAVAVGLTWTPSPARACDACITSAVEIGEGSPVRPANAGVWVYGVGIDEVTATVDDRAAAVELVPDFAPTYFFPEWDLVRLVQTPAPGSQVRYEVPFSGMICFGSPPIEVEFSVGPTDDQVPEPVAGLHWDLQTYWATDFWVGCFEPEVGRIYVRGDLAPEPGSSAVRMLEVEVGHPELPAPLELVRAEVGPDLAMGIGLTDEVFAEAALDELCVRARVKDMAGHASEVSEWVCRPCRFEDSGTMKYLPEQEPPWGEPLADGYCGEGPLPPWPELPPDDPPDATTTGTTGDAPTPDATTGDAPEPSATTGPAGSTSGDEPAAEDADGGGVTGRGCGCRSDPGRTPWWGLVAFAGLGRRRRPRSHARDHCRDDH